MPYSLLSEVPGGFKAVAQRPGGQAIKLTLSQVNKLASIYDAILKQEKDAEKAIKFAKATFRKAYKVEGGKWIVRTKKDLKESVQETLNTTLEEVGKRHSKKDNKMLREIIKLATHLMNADDLNESGVAELDAKVAELLKNKDPKLDENSWGFIYKVREYDEFADGHDADITLQEGPLVNARYGMLKTAADEGKVSYAIRTLEFKRDDGWTSDKVSSWLSSNLQESVRMAEAKLIPKHVKESAGDDKNGLHNKDRTELLLKTDLSEASYDTTAGDLVCDLVAPGKSNSKPRYYTERAIAEATGLYKGAKMYLDHPTEKEKRERPERSVKDWASTVMESFQEDGRVKGRVHIHDPWLRERLGDPVFRKEVGLSHVVTAYAHDGPIDGEQMEIVESIAKVKSVDWVTEAAQGGKVAQMLESRRKDMEDLSTLTLEDLKEKRKDLYEAVLAESKKKEKEGEADESKKVATELKESLTALDTRIAAMEGQLSEATRRTEVQRIVGEAKLSPPIAKKVVELMEGKTFEGDAESVPEDKRKTALQKLQESTAETIKAERAYVADLTGKPHITGDGDGGAQGLTESVQGRLDKRFGVDGVELDDSKKKKDDPKKDGDDKGGK